MPSILSDDEKQTVKRTVPKASNKIHAVAVAKLYVAYPARHRWTYTGLQGAAVLANDTVGNTFWIKLVDISVCVPTWCCCTADTSVFRPRCDMGPGDLRHLHVQPGPRLLPHL